MYVYIYIYIYIYCVYVYIYIYILYCLLFACCCSLCLSSTTLSMKIERNELVAAKEGGWETYGLSLSSTSLIRKYEICLLVWDSGLPLIDENRGKLRGYMSCRFTNPPVLVLPASVEHDISHKSCGLLRGVFGKLPFSGKWFDRVGRAIREVV